MFVPIWLLFGNRHSDPRLASPPSDALSISSYTRHITCRLSPFQCTFDGTLRPGKSRTHLPRPHTFQWFPALSRQLPQAFVVLEFEQKWPIGIAYQPILDRQAYEIQKTCPTCLDMRLWTDQTSHECFRHNLEYCDRSDYWFETSEIRCIPPLFLECPQQRQSRAEGPKIIPWQPRTLLLDPWEAAATDKAAAAAAADPGWMQCWPVPLHLETDSAKRELHGLC
jgi:hypothetical protein